MVAGAGCGCVGCWCEEYNVMIIHFFLFFGFYVYILFFFVSGYCKAQCARTCW